MNDIPDYTTVVGVDAKHLCQLALTWPTWKRHKPSLLDRPMMVFRDAGQVSYDEVRDVIDHPRLSVCIWPDDGVEYAGTHGSKWTDPQRHKMLAGFVYVPALFVDTPYWLKLDVDTVATGQDDWIDPEWFGGQPAIVAHPWGFTKPADQMRRLDEWVDVCWEQLAELRGMAPLDILPTPGRSRVKHGRIISWCGFFNTSFTRDCAQWASDTCGPYQLPVPSQDGFLWYCAKRLDRGIERANMKRLGWRHRSNERNIRKAIEELEDAQ